MLSKSTYLNRGQFLTSPNGRFKAVMETSGNFHLYAGKRVLFAVETQGKGFQLGLISNGNLAIYTETGEEIWRIDTKFRGEYLLCQDDGSLAIYDAYGKSIWTSVTQNGETFI